MKENPGWYFLADVPQRQVNDWQPSKYCHVDERALFASPGTCLVIKGGRIPSWDDIADKSFLSHASNRRSRAHCCRAVIFIAANGDHKSRGKRLQGFFAWRYTFSNTDSIKNVIETAVISESGNSARARARCPLSRDTYRTIIKLIHRTKNFGTINIAPSLNITLSRGTCNKSDLLRASLLCEKVLIHRILLLTAYT